MNSNVPKQGDLTEILDRLHRGDEDAPRRLLDLVYGDLRRVAQRRLTDERYPTLEATELVHEAYLRLLQGNEQRFENRVHFFSAAAEAMRRILIDRARDRSRLKRGGGIRNVTFDANLNVAIHRPEPELVLAVSEALDNLERRDTEMALIVKLRLFAGFTVAEIAELLSDHAGEKGTVSERSIFRRWRAAKAWLRRELSEKKKHSGTTVRKEDVERTA